MASSVWLRVCRFWASGSDQVRAEVSLETAPREPSCTTGARAPRALCQGVAEKELETVVEEAAKDEETETAEKELETRSVEATENEQPEDKRNKNAAGSSTKTASGDKSANVAKRTGRQYTPMGPHGPPHLVSNAEAKASARAQSTGCVSSQYSGPARAQSTGSVSSQHSGP